MRFCLRAGSVVARLRQLGRRYAVAEEGGDADLLKIHHGVVERSLGGLADIGAHQGRELVAQLLRRDEILRSEEHTSELQSLMRNSYAVFCLTKKSKQ